MPPPAFAPQRTAGPVPARGPAGPAPAPARPALAVPPEHGDDPFDSVLGDVGDEPPRRRAFDPTALVLGVVGIALVIGVVLAFKALFSSLEVGTPTPGPVASSSSASPTSTGASGEPTDDSSPTTPVSSDPPVIASAVSVDPSDDDGEHAEAVERAFDGDTSTYWYTLTYQQANFSGFKDAVGYVMTLEKPATVSEVRLRTSSTGGKVEVRSSDASDPGGGTLLASGEFGSDVRLTLDEPTETATITLWITELPTAADGSFRLELNEISLS